MLSKCKKKQKSYLQCNLIPNGLGVCVWVNSTTTNANKTNLKYILLESM